MTIVPKERQHAREVIGVSELESNDVRDRVRCTIGCGEKLPEELRSEIMHLGARGIPALLEILEDEQLATVDSPGEGWAPIHAVELLGEQHAVNAVEPMLRTLTRTDPLDILHDRIVSILSEMGPPVAEPALRAAANADKEVLESLASILARLGLHDDRILDILLAQLQRAPSWAGNLAAYGDPRALPALSKALDAFTLDQTGNPFANHALIEIREAIEELGGTLTAEQQRKCWRGRAAADAFREGLTKRMEKKQKTPSSDTPTPVRKRDRPGRNDHCWCGSGKKYKRCHLDIDAGTSFGGPSG
jgi:hypothetical protein